MKTAGESISVVYVDDDPDIRELVDIVFARETGLNMLTLEPATDVLEHIRRAQPDIVLLDLMMSGLDGRILTRRMRADTELAEVPFAFLTGEVSPQALKGLYEMGALRVICKPFEPLMLPDEVRRLLRQHRGRELQADHPLTACSANRAAGFRP